METLRQPAVAGQFYPGRADNLTEMVNEYIQGAALWGGPETAMVISSDLSHYHSYADAIVLDKKTSKSIEYLKPISRGQACGGRAINGLLHCARENKLRVWTVDLRNSGDTAGPRDRVVGYGAYIFLEA